MPRAARSRATSSCHHACTKKARPGQ
jgi:hypothetical protein